jgi:hypothetical protein
MSINQGHPDYLAWRRVSDFIFQQRPDLRPDKTWIFLPVAGIGDQLLLLSLLHKFREVHGGAVVVVTDRRSRALVSLYAPYVDLIAAVDPISIWGIQPLLRFEPGHPIATWPPLHSDGRLVELAVRHDIVISDMTRFLLRLPPGCALAPPIVPAAAQAEASEVFARHRLTPGKTVLLAPLANSMQQQLPLSWWAALARELRRHGFDVATNVVNSTRGFDAPLRERADIVPDTVAVEMSIAALPTFADLAGHVMAVRNGIADLAAFSRCRLTVFYPLGVTYDEDGTRRLHAGNCHYGAGGPFSVRRLYGKGSNCIEVDLPADAEFDSELVRTWAD